MGISQNSTIFAGDMQLISRNLSIEIEYFSIFADSSVSRAHTIGLRLVNAMPELGQFDVASITLSMEFAPGSALISMRAMRRGRWGAGQ